MFTTKILARGFMWMAVLGSFTASAQQLPQSAINRINALIEEKGQRSLAARKLESFLVYTINIWNTGLPAPAAPGVVFSRDDFNYNYFQRDSSGVLSATLDIHAIVGP